MINTLKRLSACLSFCAALTLVPPLAAADADAEQTTYLRVDAGVSLVEDFLIWQPIALGRIWTEVEPKPGYRIDAAAGYDFLRNWSVELESGFLLNPTDNSAIDLYQVPILANVRYSLPLGSKLKPYAGAGIGGVFAVLSGSFDDKSSFTFGFQGAAGIDYEISEQFDLGIGYRFLGNWEPQFGVFYSEEIYTHSILAGFKFTF